MQSGLDDLRSKYNAPSSNLGIGKQGTGGGGRLGTGSNRITR